MIPATTQAVHLDLFLLAAARQLGPVQKSA